MSTALDTYFSPVNHNTSQNKHNTPKHASSTRNKTPEKRGMTTKTLRGHQYPQVAPIHPQLKIMQCPQFIKPKKES